MTKTTINKMIPEDINSKIIIYGYLFIFLSLATSIPLHALDIWFWVIPTLACYIGYSIILPIYLYNKVKHLTINLVMSGVASAITLSMVIFISKIMSSPLLNRALGDSPDNIKNTVYVFLLYGYMKFVLSFVSLSAIYYIPSSLKKIYLMWIGLTEKELDYSPFKILGDIFPFKWVVNFIICLIAIYGNMSFMAIDYNSLPDEAKLFLKKTIVQLDFNEKTLCKGEDSKYPAIYVGDNKIIYAIESKDDIKFVKSECQI